LRRPEFPIVDGARGSKGHRGCLGRRSDPTLHGPEGTFWTERLREEIGYAKPPFMSL
jgi:hypothetical protein